MELASRFDSVESQQSSAFRSSVLTNIEQAQRGLGWFGSGPGSAQLWRIHLGFNPLWTMENSWADAAVSLGTMGAVLMAMVFLIFISRGLLEPKAVPEAGALLALTLASAGFNALEVTPSLLVLMALLMWSIRALSDSSPRRAAALQTRAYFDSR
jgi:hypothetical protein